MSAGPKLNKRMKRGGITTRRHTSRGEADTCRGGRTHTRSRQTHHNRPGRICVLNPRRPHTSTTDTVPISTRRNPTTVTASSYPVHQSWPYGILSASTALPTPYSLPLGNTTATSPVLGDQQRHSPSVTSGLDTQDRLSCPLVWLSCPPCPATLPPFWLPCPLLRLSPSPSWVLSAWPSRWDCLRP